MSTGAVTRRIAGLERQRFFASPLAWLLLGGAALLALCLCFRAEAFLARGRADLWPLFQWLPAVLLPLCLLLSLDRWRAERRSGTLELVLTQPVGISRFVLGKFRACLGLLLLALAGTAPLALLLGFGADLDWGVAASGYLAALLLGACYLAIGLCLSASGASRWLSGSGALLLCGLLYLPGSELAGRWPAGDHWLQALGGGARYAALARGVLDLRDIYYFVSLCTAFLALNAYLLERVRWSRAHSRRHRYWRALTALLVLNLLLANLWLARLPGLRWDLSAERWYSLSPATVQLLQRLDTPLLLRCDCRPRHAPRLAALMPPLQGLLAEYAAASRGLVRVQQAAPPGSAAGSGSDIGIALHYGELSRYLPGRALLGEGGDGAPGPRLQHPEYTLSRAIHDLLQQQAAGAPSEDGAHLRSVALVLPTLAPGAPGAPAFSLLRARIAANYRLLDETLEDGSVTPDADLLAVVAPLRLSARARYAIDQFLMRGGTVLLATAPAAVEFTDAGPRRRPWPSGLRHWLAHNGLRLEDALVADHPASGGAHRSDAPYYLDLRPPGLNPDHPVTAGLSRVTMAWAAPIALERREHLRLTPLLRSSPGAWLARPGEATAGGEGAVRTLAVVAQGRFHSWFVDHPRPAPASDPENPALPAADLPALVTQSPLSARLVLFASNAFLEDRVLQTDTGGAPGALRVFLNAIDWSLQDNSLLQIPPRDLAAPPLPPAASRHGLFLEGLLYGLALAWAAAWWLLYRLLARRRRGYYRRELGL